MTSIQTIPKQLPTILFHIIGWLLFVHLFFDLRGLWDSFGALFLEGDAAYFDAAFLILPLVVAYFYVNAFVFIPKWFNKNYWWFYILATVAVFLFLVIGAICINDSLATMGYDTEGDAQNVYDSILVFIFIAWGGSTSLALQHRSAQETQLKTEAKQQQLKAELQFLKAQIQPHFLFNTLNTIYSLANEEHADRTAESILKLSGMTRYIIRDAASEKVPLSQEIDFVKHYIELQKIRIGDNIPIHFTIKGLISNQQIAPLLLISFIENAFKYGVSYQKASAVIFEFDISDTQLKFRTQNHIHPHKQQLESSQLGLSNVQKRLKHLYPQRHQLQIREKEEQYIVELLIDL